MTTTPGVLDDPDLRAVLLRARSLGFLGPGPVEAHLRHTLGFLAALDRFGGDVRQVGDLGSGGGVPGLIVARARPDLGVVLVDSALRRTQFLDEAVGDLGLAGRVTVRTGRAEELGRSPLRGALDAILARSFGPPAVTAECGAPLLRPGGLLLVSEPPDAPDRWPAEGLAVLGSVDLGRWGDGPAIRVLRQAGPCPDRFPRRVGIPAKRPLF